MGMNFKFKKTRRSKEQKTSFGTLTNQRENDGDIVDGVQ